MFFGMSTLSARRVKGEGGPVKDGTWAGLACSARRVKGEGGPVKDGTWAGLACVDEMGEVDVFIEVYVMASCWTKECMHLFGKGKINTGKSGRFSILYQLTLYLVRNSSFWI